MILQKELLLRNLILLDKRVLRAPLLRHVELSCAVARCLLLQLLTRWVILNHRSVRPKLRVKLNRILSLTVGLALVSHNTTGT